MHLHSTPGGAVNLLCSPCCHTALPASWRIGMQISLDYAKSVQRQVLRQNSQGPLIPRTPAYIIRPKMDNATEYTLSVFPSHFCFCLFVLFIFVSFLIVFKKHWISHLFVFSASNFVTVKVMSVSLVVWAFVFVSVEVCIFFSSCSISATVSLSVWHVARQRTCCPKMFTSQFCLL